MGQLTDLYAIQLQSGQDTAARMRRGAMLPLVANGFSKSRSGFRPDGGGAVSIVDGTMKFRIDKFLCWINGVGGLSRGGYTVINDNAGNVDLDAGDPTNARIDLVCVRIRDNVWDGSGSTYAEVIAVKGDPATGLPPTPPDTALPVWEIHVPAGASVGTGGLTSANLGVDRRVYITGLGGCLPVANSAERDTLTADATAGGLWVWRKDIKTLEMFVDGTAGWQVIARAQPPRVRVKRTTDQSIPSGVLTTINWQATDYEQGEFWSSGSDIIVPVSGVYSITASVQWDTSTNNKAVGIYVNGTPKAFNNINNAGAIGNEYNNATASRTMPLNALDVVTVQVKQNSGGNVAAQASQSAGVFCEVVYVSK